MKREAALRRVNRPATTPRIVALESNRQRRARLLDAVHGRGEIRFTDTPRELMGLLREASYTIDIVVLQCIDVDLTDIARAVREIASSRPETALIAYCRPGSQFSIDIGSLARAGVHTFIFSGIDDSGIALRNVFDIARRQTAGEFVASQLLPLIPASLHAIVEILLAWPEVVNSLSTLAKTLGVHRRTISNWCSVEGFLAPHEFIVWVRLALVAQLLSTTGCTVESIANDLGFASGTALRNMMKRYVGIPATEVRNRGGIAHVRAELVTRLAHEKKSRLHRV